MTSVTRVGDNCSGHGCFPPRPAISGSPNVFINGTPVVRQGDGYAVHCCKKKCHPSTLANGSTAVRVNGLPVGRVGDPVRCGSIVAQGSSNVFFGG